MGQEKPKNWAQLRSEQVVSEHPEMSLTEAWQRGFAEARQLASNLLVDVTNHSDGGRQLSLMIRAIGTAIPNDVEKTNLILDPNHPNHGLPKSLVIGK